MGTYEFYGKTTEEAIQNASQELSIPVEELGIDIIEPGSAGIFGLVGGKKAKIRVTVKEDAKDLEDEESLSLAKEILENILALIPVDSRVTAERTDRRVLFHLWADKCHTSPDPGCLLHQSSAPTQLRRRIPARRSPSWGRKAGASRMRWSPLPIGYRPRRRVARTSGATIRR